jgi:hypothetical protein
MQVDIIADGPRGAFEFHQRFFTSHEDVQYDEYTKRLTIKLPPINDTQVLEFGAVTFHEALYDGVRLKGLTMTQSGSGMAPEVRIIQFTYRT